MEQIKITDATEKTVSRVFRSDTGKRLAIFFTDGTFAALRASPGYESGDEEIEDDEPDDYDLREFGILSREEYDRRQREAQDKSRAAEECRQRAEYERLKARFG